METIGLGRHCGDTKVMPTASKQKKRNGYPFYEVKDGVLPYGNGCLKHPDCFTCPFPDCTAGCHSIINWTKKTNANIMEHTQD